MTENKKAAFTLAEVLITLMILGVIAIIVVPGAIQKANDRATVVQVKKAYSELSRATNLAIAENGTPDTWILSPSTNEEITDYLLKNLKYRQKCVQTIGCWAPYAQFKNIGGATYQAESGGTNYTTAVLDNGNIISVHLWPRSSFVPWGTAEPGVYNDISLNNERTPFIYYDINGKNPPNQFGRDIFGFVITKKGLVPAGKDDTATCSVDKNGYGLYGVACTYKILQENNINY